MYLHISSCRLKYSYRRLAILSVENSLDSKQYPRSTQIITRDVYTPMVPKGAEELTIAQSKIPQDSFTDSYKLSKRSAS